ncbi:rhodanese-like domain-containing protein [Pseudoxanthomonas sangjuensis]|uniref:rhodanese-like domain-containing protein n=1 Tax=Pseudoxanthomonas sangjuensis TaxID=1503750 RepID=UPI0013908174|nr:rhodanese-like domain-containing protein [Pseudoxanthomonas sangjuensis]KAF1707711.1 sulfurtransferase [Pseudoxanthomonas sangjuensis]
MDLAVNALVAAARRRIHEVSPVELHGWRGRGHLLIDVREPDEFAAGHLPGAINLPRGVLEFSIAAHPALACQASDALARKSRTLVLYCLSGARAALAADSLQQLGFEHVHSLAGGIAAWREAALPVATETA